MPKKSAETEKKEVSHKKLTSEEYEKKVLELAKEGLTSEKIGEAMKKEGIHSQEHGKKISKILKEHNLYSSPDLKNIQRKLDELDRHFQKNKQDKKAKKDREKIYGNFRKLNAYLKKNN